MTTPPEEPAHAALGAWVDESGSDPARDPNTYVLAASVVPPDAVADVRSAMLRLRLNTPKLHWRDESTRRRELISRTIAGFVNVRHVVVVLEGQPRERPERRRRLCMERLLFELVHQDVEHVTFEARAPSQNKDDRSMVNALRTIGAVPRWLRVDHVPGRADPVLWIPDAVCGAVVSARTGTSRHLEVVRAGISVVTIPSR